MWAWTSAIAIAALTATAAPREMRVEEKGNFYVRSGVLVVLPDGLVEERNTLLAPLQEAAGSLGVARASEVDRYPDGIYIGTAADPGGLDKRRLRKYLYGVEDFGESEYRLEVEKGGVMLAAGGKRGVWYGLQTLVELLELHGGNLPYLRIRDWPVLGVRGVYLATRPTEADLEAFAALKCTHIFLDNDDFYDLTGVRAAAWREVFETARANYLEPVPVFSTLHGMEAFLRDHPMLIEGRAVSEQVTLPGVDWVSLRYPNIIAEGPEDISVTVSGVACAHGEDYWLEIEPLVAPFLPERPRWRIRRELEGAIPNGAAVTVDYAFATDDSATLCYGAPEAREWLGAAIERLIAELRPDAIHIDHGAVDRLNKDPRTAALGLNDPAFFVQTAETLESAIREVDPAIEIMMWADLVNPFQAARTYGFGEVAAYLPDSIARMGRVTIETPGEAVAWYEQLQPVVTSPPVVLVDGSTAALGAFQQMFVEYEQQEGGVVLPAGTSDSVAPLLTMAWSGLGDASIWTRRLNRYFNVALTRPDFVTIRSALVQFLNEATLRGDEPTEVNKRFDDYCGRHLDVLYEDEDGYRQVQSMLALLTEYLSLEARFTDKGDEGALRRLRGLVEDWRALDPDASEERYQRILDTVADQQLFVPASILFQEDLRYYREDRPPHPQYEIPVRPEFRDAQGETTATLTLGPGQAAVRRIDFESVRLDGVDVAGRAGGGSFESVRRWSGDGLAGVRAPLLLPGGAAREELRITATSTGAPAVLRDLRIFGAKEPAAMDCTYATLPPRMAASFEDRAWSPEAQGGAFLRVDGQTFAEAPTAVRVTRTRDDLYIGIEATELRPETMVADFNQRDAPLWQQESVEIWLQPEGRLPLRLVVNPLGARYDSEADDGGWDGAWVAVAERTDTGWRAVVRIPAELAGPMDRGSSLPFNVVRNRHSVVQERSAWAHGYGAQPDLQWGALRFP